MFRVVITKKYTKINGTGKELLNGLCQYIDALKESGIPETLIKLSIENKVNSSTKTNTKTILDNDKVRIQKIDLNNIPKEEREKIINMFFEE